MQRRSPTTDIIAFSPRYWPVNVHPVTSTGFFKMFVLQNMCRLTHEEPNTCYTSSFDIPGSYSSTRKYLLMRATEHANTCNWDLSDGWYPHPSTDYPGSGAFTAKYNLVEDTQLRPMCDWSPGVAGSPRADYGSFDGRFIQKAERIAGDTLPDGDFAPDFDYAFEVCQYKGDCSASDEKTKYCINTYTAAVIADPWMPGSDFRNLLTYRDPKCPGGNCEFVPKMIPDLGAGNVEVAFDTPDEGPYLPCPVDPATEKQVPCSDSGYGKYGTPRPTEDLGQPFIFNGQSKYGGMVLPEDLVITVTNLRLIEITTLTPDKFDVRIGLSSEWSSPYAVHPCMISLYDTGKGVGPNGKFVAASDWWKPTPEAVGGLVSRATHPSQLQVMKAPGRPVTTQCTIDTCPWPMQLFLRSNITLTASYASDFDLSRYPFDIQTLTGSFTIVGNFAADWKRDRTRVVIPNASDLVVTDATALAKLFKNSKWSAREARIMTADPSSAYDDPLDLYFSVQMVRNARSAIFKVMFPILCLSLLTVLASTLKNDSRLKVMALALIGGANMLNPETVGLPTGYSGPMPFVQALVVAHMAISGCILLITLVLSEKDFKFADWMEQTRRTQRKAAKEEFAKINELRDELFTEVLSGERVPGFVKSVNVPPSEASGGTTKVQPIYEASDELPLSPLDTPHKGKGDLQLRVMMLLPSLIHYAVNWPGPKPGNPFDPATDYGAAKNTAYNAFNRKITRFLRYTVPVSYLATWLVLYVCYFIP